MFNLFLFNVFCCWGVSSVLCWAALSFLSSFGLLLFLLCSRLLLNNFLGGGGRLVVYSRGRHWLGLCLTVIFGSVFDSRIGGDGLIIMSDRLILERLTLLVLFLSSLSLAFILSFFWLSLSLSLEFLKKQTLG